MADLAKISGFGRQTLGDWTRGKRVPPPGQLSKLAEVVGVDPGWLRDGEGPPPSSLGVQVRGVAPAVRGEARPEAVGDSARSTVLAVDRQWVAQVLGVRPEHLGVAHAESAEMAPAIQPGDTLLLQLLPDHRERHSLGLHYDPEAVYLVEADGQVLIRRLAFAEGETRLLAANPAFPPIKFNLEGMRLLGRVLWVGHPAAPARL